MTEPRAPVSAARSMPPRPDESPEPEALLAAYESALIAPDGTAQPPCDALLAILKEAVKSQIPLSTLDLRSVEVGRTGARALAAVLQLDSFITFANLEETDLGDDGVTAVADALRTHPTLFRRPRSWAHGIVISPDVSLSCRAYLPGG